MTDRWWKTAFLCLAFVMILLLGYAILVAKLPAANAFVLLAAAVLCGFLAHIDRLESFSASITGVKATLRKLSITVETAETLIASLKRMQLAYAKAVFKLVSDPDVAEAPDKYARRDAAKKLVLEEAEKAGLDQAQIVEILDIERNSVCSEYAAAVYYYAHQHLQGVGTDVLQAELSPLMHTHPSPDQLEQVLDKLSINDPKTRSFIEDYRHYVTTGWHRRPEIWARRGEWMARYLGFPDVW